MTLEMTYGFSFWRKLCSLAAVSRIILKDETPTLMRAFLDTEFTGLTSAPRLLSIGVVAENGKELYMELTDGWVEATCSAWVRQHVLPLLGDGEKFTRRNAGRRIASWLSSFETPPTLLGDTDWDTTLVAELMDECEIPRDTYRLEALVYSGKAQASAFEEARQQYFARLHATPHHALNDARAFREAWDSVFGEKPVSSNNPSPSKQ